MTTIELRRLNAREGQDIRDMVLEIGPRENGFGNGFYTSGEAEFQAALDRNLAMSQGDDLAPHLVPQTVYWLYVGGLPVGYGKLRHRLNDKLRLEGGHIGYVIRPTERQKGYGKLLLQELVKEAKHLGLSDVLLTCNEDNTASRRIIEGCGGRLEDVMDGKCRYWIQI
ncbi:GCN5 family acetyltransferase [Gordoniibacillus kamchatkensis]|uniref:GCN5 family acetyltransferase n=1 Tax=Gordoniibacillus kamchatkensis TaxID=1590651 RepID=A0ABR5AEL9_9BACL|nr:GNAT family N-acetyltransferase [Paenibacillus sp. VKM B-2647]KIL39454.1 GCN5 family acetyltransferase [Paenibacillus sp. VKM B-2647]